MAERKEIQQQKNPYYYHLREELRRLDRKEEILEGEKNQTPILPR